MVPTMRHHSLVKWILAYTLTVPIPDRTEAKVELMYGPKLSDSKPRKPPLTNMCPARPARTVIIGTYITVV